MDLDSIYNLGLTCRLEYHIKLYLEVFAACPNFVTECLGASLDTHGWRNQRLTLVAAPREEVDRLRDVPTQKETGI